MKGYGTLSIQSVHSKSILPSQVFLDRTLIQISFFLSTLGVRIPPYGILNPLIADIQIKGRAHCAELLVFFPFLI